MPRLKPWMTSKHEPRQNSIAIHTRDEWLKYEPRWLTRYGDLHVRRNLISLMMSSKSCAGEGGVRGEAAALACRAEGGRRERKRMREGRAGGEREKEGLCGFISNRARCRRKVLSGQRWRMLLERAFGKRKKR